jgi:hypothetical protein
MKNYKKNCGFNFSKTFKIYNLYHNFFILNSSSSKTQETKKIRSKSFDKSASSAKLAPGSIPEIHIIESRDSTQDFENLQDEELELNIQSRRNKIFLLMEEVRRLKIQQRVKTGTVNLPKGDEFSIARENFKSALPFMPPVTEKTFKSYASFFVAIVTAIILFGGIVAPILEVKLGIGGRSYREFIESIGLPKQLAEVDPIVASFCGGSVGVLSALFIVEANNISLHRKERCFYCRGSGYLSCGRCDGKGLINPLDSIDKGTKRCLNCSGTSKVMCISCLCTGKQLATEHDPRLDPWN